jgi:hypothetical protein
MLSETGSHEQTRRSGQGPGPQAAWRCCDDHSQGPLPAVAVLGESKTGRDLELRSATPMLRVHSPRHILRQQDSGMHVRLLTSSCTEPRDIEASTVMVGNDPLIVNHFSSFGTQVRHIDVQGTCIHTYDEQQAN